MMSDYDRDIDIESDEGDDLNSRESQLDNSQCYSQAEKRAHHNALERKRRDQLKDSFMDLQNSVPLLQSEKNASRVQILKKTAEYIQFMNHSNSSTQQEIDNLDRQNRLLESQIRKHERELRQLSKTQPVDIGTFDQSESESSDSDSEQEIRNPKKKIASFHN